MGQELQPWLPLPTTSSRAQKISNAKTVLATTTGPADAARAAKRLVGSYAHLKAPDPETFVENVAAVLSLYPLDIVRECVDPRFGIARKLKWLSIQELGDWLDSKLEYYRLVAATSPHPPALPAPVPPPNPEMAARASELLGGLARRLARRGSRDIVSRQRRVHRYLAERRLRTDKRRALAELQPLLEQETRGATEGLT